MDKIHIAICTDTNYVMPCGVLFYSICKNNTENQIVFHAIIDDSVNERDKKSLESIASNFKQEISFHLIDGHLFDSFPNLGPGIYVSKATYYRLYLTEILPTDIDKVLYLDCDMIVRKDLGGLWSKDISHYAVGVSADGWESKIQIYNRLHYPYSKGYFNAGMLMVNLRYWRENDVLNRCLVYIKDHYLEIESHDQDVLNYVLQDEKVSVGITYNFLENYLYKKELALYDYYKYKEEIDSVKNDPAIIHYVASKPWVEGCVNPYKGIFERYKKQTLWADVPLAHNKNRFRSQIKLLLQKAGLLQKKPELINNEELKELTLL